MEIHPIKPIYDENSKILILGSFPSVASRREAFFYAHPQNRFWRVLAAALDKDVPKSIEEKRAFLKDARIALWDAAGKCNIENSSDSTIRDVSPNDISPILESADIKKIFTNGKTADKIYKKYIEPKVGIKSVCLPSTSPANAAYSLERLIYEWSVIREYLTIRENLK